MSNLKVFRNPTELAANLVEELVGIVVNHPRPSFHLAISGGKTPDLIYMILAKNLSSSTIKDKIHFWWVDERMVPPENDESNFGKFKQILLSKINISESNIHRIKGENNPEDEVLSYTLQIKECLRFKNDWPVFDLVLLGMGNDGHTASIFPDQMVLLESKNVCDSAVHPETGQKRITLTGKVLNNAEKICFVVTGNEKAQCLSEILSGSEKSELYPAFHIKPCSGELTWYADESAAILLGQ